MDKLYIICGGNQADDATVKGPKMKQLAFYVSGGAASDMIWKRFKDHPTETWAHMLAQLSRSTINQSVADYAELLLDYAVDAWSTGDLDAD